MSVSVMQPQKTSVSPCFLLLGRFVYSTKRFLVGCVPFPLLVSKIENHKEVSVLRFVRNIDFKVVAIFHNELNFSCFYYLFYAPFCV